MVDIVIVNWNSDGYLAKCIDSIFTIVNEKLINKVIIIDNNSSDESMSIIKHHEKIVLISNNENLGFSKACNQGFRICQSEYVLLFNPDAQLMCDTLHQCNSFMDTHKEIDILGCSLFDDQDKLTVSCARFPTPLRFFYDATGLSKLASKVFKPAILMTDWDHKNSKKVDQVMGAFMFMRTSIFKKIGYFDERYFVYFEELDFSKRVADAGGISFYNADIKAIHSGGGTTANVKAFRLFLILRSRLLYAKKHFSFAGYAFVWGCTFLIEPITRNMLLLMKLNIKEIKEVFKGYMLLIAGSDKN